MNELTSPGSLSVLGPPARTIAFPDASLTLWSLPPIAATSLSGCVSVPVAEAMAEHFTAHFNLYDTLVTIHEWSGITDHESAARKLMQQLAREMKPKQRELVLYLGRGDSLVKKIAINTAETVTRFRGIPIEIIKDSKAFEQRVMMLVGKYRPEHLQAANPDVSVPRPSQV